jgi:hypothetical protein
MTAVPRTTRKGWAKLEPARERTKVIVVSPPAPISFAWLRYWTPQGEIPTRDDGYLVPPQAKPPWHRGGQGARLATLQDLAEVPCLVLLGDVGAGKSFELAAEAERLRHEAAVGHRVLRLDLKRLSAALVEREVFEGEDYTGWVAGRHGLTLLLDSMDECWRRIGELGPLLLSRFRPLLAEGGRPPLRVRLSCRAAEWQTEIEADLREIFGENGKGTRFQVWTLAPLTAENVVEAARASGLDPAKFLADIAASDANALAAHPLTLRILLELANEGTALGRSRADLYAAGCLTLCQDGHQAEGARARLATSASERLLVASHLAAVSVLSNRYLILGSPNLPAPDEPGILGADALVGQVVRGEQRTIGITAERLEETLQSGLFEAQPGAAFTWRHQSYAEYLAARYLSERGLGLAQLTSLLCDTSGGPARIWPQLEETACWLVALVPGLLEHWLRDNASVFVRCDPARLAAADRERMVEYYLDQVRRHEARLPDWSEHHRLERLVHPGLQAQLEPILQDRKENWYVRDLALDLAQAGNVRALSSLLLDLMLDRAEVHRIRHSAGVALRAWADDEVRAELKRRLTPESVADPHDDLRGCVLAILWPARLTVEELVKWLTPPQRDNYVGSYQRFFGELLPASLRREDLPVLIEWVRTVAPVSHHHDNDPYDGLCGKIAGAGFRELANPDVRAAFVTLLCDYERRDGPLLPEKSRDLGAETPRRRLLWADLIAGSHPIRDLVVKASLPESGLVVADDFGWVVTQVQGAAGAARARWLELAELMFAPVDFPGQLEEIWSIASTDPAVATWVRRRTSNDLMEDGERNWRKEAYYRKVEEEKAEAERKPFEAQIDEALDLYVGGNTGAMWWLIEHLQHPVREPAGRGYRAEIGWKQVSAKQRARLVTLAPSYLGVTSVESAEVYDPKNTYRSYRAGLRLLLELERVGSPCLGEQSREFWAAWAPVLFTYYDRVQAADDEPWSRLHARCYREARVAYTAALERWLADRQERYLPVEILAEIPVTEDAAVERILVEGAGRAGAEHGGNFALFDLLLRQGSNLAETTLVACLEADARRQQPERAVLADALLLCDRTEAYGPAVLARMTAEAAYGEKVFGQLNSGGDLRSGWVARLDAEAVALLWEWLDASFPGDLFDEQSNGLVTLRHEIQRFRSGLLTYLEHASKTGSVAALGGLVRRHPELPWLGQVLAKARHNGRRGGWRPPTVAALEGYFVHPDQRPLCHDGDLCDAILRSLARYEASLKGGNPPKELWNEPSGRVKTWRPKEETNLSDCLARHLERDLTAHRVTAVRESELRRRTGSAPGDEPDIVVHAPSASSEPAILTVILEVKGAWNADLPGSVTSQLHDRYLRSARCGIHVTGYFTCGSWGGTDGRRKSGLSRKPLAEVTTIMRAERGRLAATTDRRVEVVVLDATL